MGIFRGLGNVGVLGALVDAGVLGTIYIGDEGALGDVGVLR